MFGDFFPASNYIKSFNQISSKTSRPAPGPDLLSAGPRVFRKKCGALQLGRHTLFFLEKLATFLVITVCQLSLLRNWPPFLLITLFFTRKSTIFPAYKTLLLLLWGPLFVGARVRPNMLNVPKFAAENVYFPVVNFSLFRVQTVFITRILLNPLFSFMVYPLNLFQTINVHI